MAELPVHRRHAGRLERHGTMAGVRQRRKERHGERRREDAARRRWQRRYPCADSRRLAGCGVHESRGECGRRAPSERDRRQYGVRHDGRSERRRVERAAVAHEQVGCGDRRCRHPCGRWWRRECHDEDRACGLGRSPRRQGGRLGTSDLYLRPPVRCRRRGRSDHGPEGDDSDHGHARFGRGIRGDDSGCFEGQLYARPYALPAGRRYGHLRARHDDRPGDGPPAVEAGIRLGTCSRAVAFEQLQPRGGTRCWRLRSGGYGRDTLHGERFGYEGRNTLCGRPSERYGYRHEVRHDERQLLASDVGPFGRPAYRPAGRGGRCERRVVAAFGERLPRPAAARCGRRVHRYDAPLRRRPHLHRRAPVASPERGPLRATRLRFRGLRSGADPGGGLDLRE